MEGEFGSGLDGTFGCGASAQRRKEWGLDSEEHWEGVEVGNGPKKKKANGFSSILCYKRQG